MLLGGTFAGSEVPQLSLPGLPAPGLDLELRLLAAGVLQPEVDLLAPRVDLARHDLEALEAPG
jgi:hypothetical protein